MLLMRSRLSAAIRMPAIVLAAGLFANGMAAHAADQVSVQLDYVVRGNHAMFFVAKSTLR